MPRPIDLSENNQPIPAHYDGKAGHGNCACGGKGCKSKNAQLLEENHVDKTWQGLKELKRFAFKTVNYLSKR